MIVHTELFTGVDVAFGIRGPEILSGLPASIVFKDGARSIRVDPQALYRCGGIFETTHAYTPKGSVWNGTIHCGGIFETTHAYTPKGSVWHGTIHFAYCGKQWYFLFDPELRVR